MSTKTTRLASSLFLLAAVTLIAARVLAASLHFVGSPKASVEGDAVVVSGKVAGLGNEDITVTVEVDGEVVVFCISPGGNRAPGQNKAPFTAVDSRTFVPSAKNGQFTFTIVVDLAEAIEDAVGQHDCPNRNWTKEAGDITVDSAKVTVEQGGQTITRTINL